MMTAALQLAPDMRGCFAATPALAALAAGAHWSLECQFFDNAVALAERVHAAARSAASAHLLATALVRRGDYLSALVVLQPWIEGTLDAAAAAAATDDDTPSQILACRYLYARTCLTVNKMAEGEAVMVRTLTEVGGKLSAADESAVLALLGGLCQYVRVSAQEWLAPLARSAEELEGRSLYLYLGGLGGDRWAGRTEQAVQYFRQSLAINSFLWYSFAQLAKLGTDPQPAECFHEGTPALVEILSQYAAEGDEVGAAAAPPPAEPSGVPAPGPVRRALVDEPAVPATPSADLGLAAMTPRYRVGANGRWSADSV